MSCIYKIICHHRSLTFHKMPLEIVVNRKIYSASTWLLKKIKIRTKLPSLLIQSEKCQTANFYTHCAASSF